MTASFLRQSFVVYLIDFIFRLLYNKYIKAFYGEVFI